jgi:hypothetical protein
MSTPIDTVLTFALDDAVEYFSSVRRINAPSTGTPH